MKFKIPFVFALFILAGCASLGLQQPQTFNERIAYAREAVNGVLATTTNSLDAKAISSDDALWVRDSAKRTLTLLDASEVAFDAGDITTAEGRLQLAQGILRELQTYVGRSK